LNASSKINRVALLSLVVEYIANLKWPYMYNFRVFAFFSLAIKDNNRTVALADTDKIPMDILPSTSLSLLSTKKAIATFASPKNTFA